MDWELHDGEKQHGPFTEEAVVDAIRRGLKPTTQIRPVGKDRWKDIRAHGPFAAALDEVATQGDAGVPAEPPPDQPAAPRLEASRSPRTVTWVLAGLAFGIAAVGVAFAVTRSRTEPKAPNVSTDSIEERVRTVGAIKSMDKAIAYTKPAMTDDNQGLGHLLFTMWASEHMDWSDVYVEKSETTPLKVKKDSASERGKRVCVRGRVLNIKADHLAEGHSVFDGLLLDLSAIEALDEATIPYMFSAVGDTGDIVEGTEARFCGVVTGMMSYEANVGGKRLSVRTVGMFDLPKNHVAR